MSLSVSRYESQNVVNSFNLFVDTHNADVIHSQNTGDDVHIHMESNSIEASDGEIIRLSLTNFTMANNAYMIDETNCRVQVNTENSANPALDTSDVVRIPKGFYANVGDVATAFQTALISHLNSLLSTTNDVNGNPITDRVRLQGTVVQPSGAMDSGNRLLDFRIECEDSSNALVLTFPFTSLTIQCRKTEDTHIILGAKVKRGSDAAFQSLKTTLSTDNDTGAQFIRIQGFFPMQRMSDPYVYLRCSSVGNGLESAVMDSGVGQSNSDVVSSNILGKIMRDTEFIHYHSSNDEYFINLQQRRLSNLHLFLTDSKGRRLGRLADNRTNTASGLEVTAASGEVSHVSTEQSTLGNLFFTAVIKCQIIKVRQPKNLESKKPPEPKPAREAQSGVVVWQNYGRPR